MQMANPILVPVYPSRGSWGEGGNPHLRSEAVQGINRQNREVPCVPLGRWAATTGDVPCSVFAVKILTEPWNGISHVLTKSKNKTTNWEDAILLAMKQQFTVSRSKLSMRRHFQVGDQASSSGPSCEWERQNDRTKAIWLSE